MKPAEAAHIIKKVLRDELDLADRAIRSENKSNALRMVADAAAKLKKVQRALELMASEAD